jgi:Bacteriophage Sf6, terminase small subunit-like
MATLNLPLKRFKPSTALADSVCFLVSQGASVRHVCSEHSIDPKQFYRWLESSESVRQQYARAKEKAADKMAGEIVEIADNATPQDAHVARLKVDARKWVAAKLLPPNYGDRLAEVNVNTQINLASISVEDEQRLQRRRQELLKEGDTNPAT